MNISRDPSFLRFLVRVLLRLFPEDVPGITRATMEETILDRFRAERARPGFRSMAWAVPELWDLLSRGVLERMNSLSDWSPLAGFKDDIRFAVRALMKHRTFALGGILMLAIGIGVNMSVFSLATAMSGLHRRFEDPDRLFFVWRVEGDWDEAGFSAPAYLELRNQAGAFEEMAAYQRAAPYITGDGEPLRIAETRTTPGLLPMLGLEAEIGRLAGPADNDPGAPDVVVLTHRFWTERYGAETSVLGRTLFLNDVPHTVIGVLPAKVEFESLWRESAVFTPLAVDPADADWSNQSLWVMARMAEGASLEQAQAQVTGITDRQTANVPETDGPTGARVESFERYFLSFDDRMALFGMQSAVVAVLLIACLNLANLLMAKGGDRQGEMAIRLAVGASRARMIRQLLMESLLLASVGGAIGILLGRWGIQFLLSAVPTVTLLPAEVGWNWRLFSFALALTAAATLVFGLTPALMATRASVGAGVKESGAGASSGSRRKRFRNGLLVTQLALTVPLVGTAAASWLNIRNLLGTDFGFPVEGLLLAQVDLPGFRYPEDQQKARFYREAVEAVRGVPRVTAAAAGMAVPIGAGMQVAPGPYVVAGHEVEEGSARGPRAYLAVTEGFFETLGVPIRRGRSFTEADGPGDPAVAIVNEAFARRFWPGEDALGKRLFPDPPAGSESAGPDPAPRRPVTVVGVVSDFGASFYGEPPSPMFFLPVAQRPVSGLLLVVRTAADPLSLIPSVREAVDGVDSGVPVTAFNTGEGKVDLWLQESRAVGAALGLLAVVALCMALVGLYGMVAYSVTQRTYELGVRMVLGADRGAIRLSVMRSFLVVAGIGLFLGVAISVAIGVVARSVLVLLQVSFLPMALGITGLLSGVVVLASYVPAQRATSIQPVVALKSE